MEEEESLFSFNLFSPFAPAGTFAAGRGAGATPGVPRSDVGGAAARGGAAAGAGRGRGGGARGGGTGAGGGRGRNKPDPLAGQCPVCRAKIKGAFNGREKNGIVGLRLTIGKPVDDPREESGKMKVDPREQNDESDHSKESDDEEVVLPIGSKKEEATVEEAGVPNPVDQQSKTKRSRKRSSTSESVASTRRSSRIQAGEAQATKRTRQASDSSATQTE